MSSDGGPLGSKGVLALVLLAVACASPCSAADGVSWGTALSGIRLGVSIQDGPEGKELHVAFQNVGSTPQSLVVEQFGGGMPSADNYFFDIVAVGPDRKAHRINFWTGSGPGRLVPVGLVWQRVQEIPARRTYEFRHLLKYLVEFHKGGDIPLENLLRQGYTVRIDYKVQPRSVEESLSRYPSLWTGEIQSGEAGLAPERR